MASGKNFFNGRIHLQDAVFLRFSFTSSESAITLEDLKCPQVESDFQPFCGRIDFGGYEPEQLLRQWDDIVCANYNSEDIFQYLMLDKDSVSDNSISSNSNGPISSFTLLPPGFALQRLPHTVQNRTICGMEVTCSIQVELNSQTGTLTFARDHFVEEANSAADISPDAHQQHVRRRAVITLDQNRGMKRMDMFMRLLQQIRSLMFPSIGRGNKLYF
jgi:hypothetical protein